MNIDLNQRKAYQWAENGQMVALFNADSHSDGWSDRAYGYVVMYAQMNKGCEFMAENIRKFAYESGLDRPANERAFGPVMVRARKAGIIKDLGIRATSSVTAHCANAKYYTA